MSSSPTYELPQNVDSKPALCQQQFLAEQVLAKPKLGSHQDPRLDNINAVVGFRLVCGTELAERKNLQLDPHTPASKSPKTFP